MSKADGRHLVEQWAKWWVIPAAALVWYLAHFDWLPPLGESLCLAGLIVAGIVHGDRLPFRWLAIRPLAWLGKISYSVYVWQQFFIIGRGGYTVRFLCMIPPFALGSYYLIELPCVELGRRLIGRKAGRTVVRASGSSTDAAAGTYSTTITEAHSANSSITGSAGFTLTIQ
jgi:peptidoglycan/LPS O-acetylase OafA/YrhL